MTLQYDFRMARNTICNFIPVVCQAIVDALKDEVISCPTTPDEWRPIADEFLRRWSVVSAWQQRSESVARSYWS